MVIQRALSSFILGPLAIWLVWQGEIYYFIPITIIMVVATLEYVHITKRLGWSLPRWLMVGGVVAQLAAAQWYNFTVSALLLVITFMIIVGQALYDYEYRKKVNVTAEWIAMTAGVVLLGWLCGHFLRVRTLEVLAQQWTVYALLATWFVDTAAFGIGTFFAGKIVLGRHQLAPRLSPNKTVEGYVGGMVLGLSAAIPLGYYVLGLPLLPILFLGGLIGLISPAGDLAMSLLKREAGVKDSGHLLPGHGGALDRIDSLMWSVTFAYYVALYLGGAA